MTTSGRVRKTTAGRAGVIVRGVQLGGEGRARRQVWGSLGGASAARGSERAVVDTEVGGRDREQRATVGGRDREQRATVGGRDRERGAIVAGRVRVGGANQGASERAEFV